MNYKTAKQIADELGVDKQKVYRIIKKNRFNEAVQEGQVKWYDEAVQSIIKSNLRHFKPHQNHIKTASMNHFNEAVDEVVVRIENAENTEKQPHQNRFNDAVSEAVVELLKNELEAKNKLIDAQQRTIDRLTSTVEAYSQKELASKLIDGQRLIDNSSNSRVFKKNNKWFFWFK